MVGNCDVQRQEYKNLLKGKPSRLNEKRMQLLNSVGFAWELQRGGKRRQVNISDTEVHQQDSDQEAKSPGKKTRKSGKERDSRSEGGTKSGFVLPGVALIGGEQQQHQSTQSIPALPGASLSNVGTSSGSTTSHPQRFPTGVAPGTVAVPPQNQQQSSASSVSLENVSSQLQMTFSPAMLQAYLLQAANMSHHSAQPHNSVSNVALSGGAFEASFAQLQQSGLAHTSVNLGNQGYLRGSLTNNVLATHPPHTSNVFSQVLGGGTQPPQPWMTAAHGNTALPNMMTLQSLSMQHQRRSPQQLVGNTAFRAPIPSETKVPENSSDSDSTPDRKLSASGGLVKRHE
jgi:hypothetical protein